MKKLINNLVLSVFVGFMPALASSAKPLGAYDKFEADETGMCFTPARPDYDGTLLFVAPWRDRRFRLHISVSDPHELIGYKTLELFDLDRFRGGRIYYISSLPLVDRIMFAYNPDRHDFERTTYVQREYPIGDKELEISIPVLSLPISITIEPLPEDGTMLIRLKLKKVYYAHRTELTIARQLARNSDCIPLVSDNNRLLDYFSKLVPLTDTAVTGDTKDATASEGLVDDGGDFQSLESLD